MGDGVETPAQAGSEPASNGASHVLIAVIDAADEPKNELDRTAQNSDLKRVQTKAKILRTIEKRSQVVIQFDNVCAWVPTLVLPGGQAKRSLFSSCLGKRQTDDGSKPTQAPKERQILFNVSGEVNPGEVLALMGPSGGGKTSLLTLLGGRSTARLDGTVSFNGAKMNKAIKRKLGYVMQDDLLFAELTVYETLYYAALLRLPRHWSRADKLARVDLVISGLGLERCRDTIIGSHSMRGVSGGERKRVSIGHELLINPSMLLLDEPTSGLDSTTALRLMHTLRSLASGGRTIVTSIHQPSSRLYRQMDKLMLLAQGRCMYYGDAQSVATWFKMLGQPCPFGTNIADHILDLANGDVVARSGTGVAAAAALSDGGSSGVRRRAGGAASTAADAAAAGDDDDVDDRGGAGGDHAAAATCSSSTEDGSSLEEVHRQLVDAFDKRAFGRGRGGIRAADLLQASSGSDPSTSSAAGGGGGGGGSGIKVYDNGGSAVDLMALTQPVEDAEGGSGDDKWGASWVDQVRHLTVRSIKTRRFQSLSVQKTGQLLAVAVLAGLFWWQQGAALTSAQDVLDVGGLLFFIELFMGFATLFAALFTFPLEFQMLVKERQSGMYRLSAYYLARTASDLPMDCLLPSLFVWIVYWMSGLRLDAGAFFAHWASVLLIVLTSQSVGLLIGATVINPQNGQTAATIFMLATMLVGGYYVRGMPVWIAWMKFVSFIYWGWNLLLKIEFRHRPYDCELTAGAAADASGCTVKQAEIFGIDVDSSLTRDVCILVGMLIFLRLCVYYALRYKTTFKGHK